MATRFPNRWCRALWATAFLAAPSSALGNGRFPRSERLLENAGDPRALTLAATYGILRTKDGGSSWYHLCEASFSLEDAYLGDPIVDFTTGGTMLVGVQTSLNLSRDDGCDWTVALGDATTFVVDQAVAKTGPPWIVALIGTFENGAIVYSLRQSNDEGRT